MAASVVLPASMDQGTLARWVKAEGDLVNVGDVLAEIETDKAVMDLEATHEGELTQIVVPQGTREMPGGTVLAILSGPNASPSEPKHVQKRCDRIFASPRARRLAKEADIALTNLLGSGPGGRIIERDIEAARTRDTTYLEMPHDLLRKSIARRLSESKRNVPHFYLSVDCELDALFTLRKQLASAMPTPAGDAANRQPTINDFVIKAWGMAVAHVPEVNVSWTEEAMLEHSAVDVGVAVAIPRGIITPIIREADKKKVWDISTEMKDLAARAAARRLRPEEYTGGTTAISNLGMLGISSFSAIINPPHSTILAVGAGEKRVVVKDGAIAVATIMSCTLSADHRSMDGATGARVLAEFKKLIENPVVMYL